MMCFASFLFTHFLFVHFIENGQVHKIFQVKKKTKQRKQTQIDCHQELEFFFSDYKILCKNCSCQ